MLKFFAVSNFKSFKDEEQISFSLDDRFYLIVGKNDSGKSNLVQALFDIQRHLNEEQIIEIDRDYLFDPNACATFKYEFIFNDDLLTYIYSKSSSVKLVKEELLINHKRVLYYDYLKNEGYSTLTTLNQLKLNSPYSLSIINEIKSEVSNETFKQFINYVKLMKLYQNELPLNRIYIDQHLYKFLSKFRLNLNELILNKSLDKKRFSSSELELINLYRFLISSKKGSLIVFDNFASFLDEENTSILMKILKSYKKQILISSSNYYVESSSFINKQNIINLKNK